MYLEERASVGLTIRVRAGIVHPKAEMLFPMRGALGYLQPFRFTGLRAEKRQTLEKEITELLRQTMVPEKSRPRVRLPATPLLLGVILEFASVPPSPFAVAGKADSRGWSLALALGGRKPP